MVDVEMDKWICPIRNRAARTLWTLKHARHISLSSANTLRYTNDASESRPHIKEKHKCLSLISGTTASDRSPSPYFVGEDAAAKGSGSTGRGNRTLDIGNWVMVGHKLGSPQEMIVISNTVFQVSIGLMTLGILSSTK